MTERAQVTSVEALEAFRSSLIIYLTKARPVLEEMTDDVRRTRTWLQIDRRIHWQNEARRCRRDWEQAQQELFSAKMAQLQGPTAAQQLSVTRARRALEAAEEKLRLLRRWSREFENRTDPLVKQLGQLHSILASDMPHAVACLAQVVNTLDAYADIALPAAPVNPAQPSRLTEAGNPVESQPARVSPSPENGGEHVPIDKPA